MWLDIVDKAQLLNLDHIESILLDRAPGDPQWTLTAVGHSGAVHAITSYKDSGEAHRALDRVRHALETIVLSSDGAR
ncbi:MAG TPA: hypothetical protein VEW91_12265 [bacterium]|nr:hypothetical protein [bacterium]